MDIGFADFLKKAIGLGFIRKNADGNIIANVNHRTGLLASLRALAGGLGEISVATDADVLLVHTGVPNTAKPYFRGGSIAEGSIAFDGMIVAAGAVATHMDHTAIGILVAGQGAASIYDANDGIFKVPTANRPFTFDYWFDFVWPANSTGTYRRVRLEASVDGGVSWGIVPATVSNAIFWSTTQPLQHSGRLIADMYSQSGNYSFSEVWFRVVLLTDSTSALMLTSSKRHYVVVR